MKSLSRHFAPPILTRLLFVCLLFAIPAFSKAQVDEAVQDAQTALEEAQKKADDAKYAVEDAQKEVDKRVEQLKKDADDPKEHGSNAELSRLREKLKQAKEDLEKKEAELEVNKAKKAELEAKNELKAAEAENPRDKAKVDKAKAKLKRAEKLRKALQAVFDALKNKKDIEKAKKALEKAKAENALEEAKEAVELEKARRPRDPQKLSDAEKALEDAQKALDKIKAKEEAEKALDQIRRSLEAEKKKAKPDPKKLEDLEKKQKEAEKKLEEIYQEQASLPATGTSDKTRFYALVGISGNLPLSGLSDRTVGLNPLQAAIFEPVTLGRLMEILEGEYILGTLSNETVQSFVMEGRAEIMPGLRAGFGVGRRFELQAGVQYFQAAWSGNFPVTVFPFDGSEPRTMQGSMQASASGMLTETYLTFFLTRQKVSPFVKGGLRGIFPLKNQGAAELAGVELPLEFEPLSRTFSPVAAAGIRAGLLRNAVAEVAVSYGKLADGKYAPALEMGLSWKF